MGAKDEPGSGPEEFRKPDIQFYSVILNKYFQGLGKNKQLPSIS
jgi:hypothetical protein